ncbi:HAD-IIIC family phosphatase [Tenggerimyces flavus]|uniref:HAD-IIIC family phosphatase n=1 Tax=Tenggerimyces flavus TaxID=1708749 RepID=A0ABV7YNP6_9ACTN|nr:HAD-IIIC family phosphatase [Tenggerimyces flavus]MBM7789579.1 FkbH-like protein [Tenggerimyces flavus]
MRLGTPQRLLADLTDSDGPLLEHRDGTNAVLLRVEDLAATRRITHSGWRRAIESGADLFEASVVAAASSGRSFTVVTCPPSPGVQQDRSAARIVANVEHDLVARLRSVDSVNVSESASLLAESGLARTGDYYSAFTDRLAQIPYTALFYAAAGTHVVRRTLAAEIPRPKVLVVDCDATLWDGYVAEDGVPGIRIGSHRRALQEFLVAQVQNGRLLCLCSKNDESDVMKVLAKHPDMVVREEHVAAARVNWRPKSENLRSLAAELNLALDSFVFLDDSPVECAEVRVNCPEVLALRLPNSAERAARFVRHCWPLDTRNVTDADHHRTRHYRVERERRRLRRTAPSLSDYLAQLGTTVTISAATQRHHARMAQLTARTNQFNLTGRRWSAAEFANLPRRTRALIVEVEDHFDTYGVVGLMVYDHDEEVLRIRSFLLSCRVLGRGVEHQMVRRLGQAARASGLKRITFDCVRTGRNQPALEFLDGLGVEEARLHDDRPALVLSSELAAGAAYDPDRHAGEHSASSDAVPTSESSPAAERMPWRLVEHIANELNDAHRVLAAVEESGTPAGDLAGEQVSSTVAALWARRLGRPPVTPQDEFFGTGGTSLELVWFLADLHDAFEVQLSLDEVLEDGVRFDRLVQAVHDLRQARIGGTVP